MPTKTYILVHQNEPVVTHTPNHVVLAPHELIQISPKKSRRRHNPHLGSPRRRNHHHAVNVRHFFCCAQWSRCIYIRLWLRSSASCSHGSSQPPSHRGLCVQVRVVVAQLTRNQGTLMNSELRLNHILEIIHTATKLLETGMCLRLPTFLWPLITIILLTLQMPR